MSQIKEIPKDKPEFSSHSSDKLLQIMEYLAENRLPIRLQELSEGLGMPQPTVLRYLNTLIRQDYVYKDDETLRYALTWKICRLGHLITSRIGIRSIAGPFVTALAHQLDAGACVATGQEYELIYLDVADNPANMPGSLQRIGKGAPMQTTGSGKVLLSGRTDTQVEEMLRLRGMPRFTDKTIVDQEQLLRELETVRRQGYAIDDEECEAGVRCVSVPLRDYTDRIVAALSVFGPVDELGFDRIEGEILPALQEAAREICRRMGSSGAV